MRASKHTHIDIYVCMYVCMCVRAYVFYLPFLWNGLEEIKFYLPYRWYINDCARACMHACVCVHELVHKLRYDGINEVYNHICLSFLISLSTYLYTHTYAHTHTHTYIYVCVCVWMLSPGGGGHSGTEGGGRTLVTYFAEEGVAFEDLRMSAIL